MSNKNLTLHHVVSVEACPITENNDSYGNPYYVRNFVILDEDGAEFTITMFGDNKTNLSFEV